MSEYEQSPTCGELAKALATAQASITHAGKSGKNPHLKNNYSTLSDVWDACREPLTRNGLAVIQMPIPAPDGWVYLRTLLLHASGEYFSSVLPLPVEKANAQAYGSTLTYARRYALSALVGVCPDDDDGEGAVGRGHQPQQRSQQQAPRNQAPANAPPASASRPPNDRPAQASAPKPEQPPAAKPNGSGMSDLDRQLKNAYSDAYPHGTGEHFWSEISEIIGRPVAKFAALGETDRETAIRHFVRLLNAPPADGENDPFEGDE